MPFESLPCSLSNRTPHPGLIAFKLLNQTLFFTEDQRPSLNRWTLPIKAPDEIDRVLLFIFIYPYLFTYPL